jgi:zinc protease
MVLQIRLRERLRSEAHAVYQFSVQAAVTHLPEERRHLAISFTCASENIERLRSAVFEELDAIARRGVEQSYLLKVSEQLKRRYESDSRDNGFWLGWLSGNYLFDEALSPAEDLEKSLVRVTSEHVQATAARMFDPKNYELVVMKPADAGRPGEPAR